MIMKKRNPSPEQPENATPMEGNNALLGLIEGEAFKKAVKRIPERLLAMSEDELRELSKPNQTDYALKCALWNEIRLADQAGAPFKASRIYGGICTQPHWSANVLGNPEKLAWLLSPIRDYGKMLEPLLAVMVERYWQILRTPFFDEKGPLPAVMKAVLQLGKQIEDRLLGSSIQRIASQTMKVEAKTSAVGIRPGESETAYMERLQCEIKELDRQERELMHLPPIES